MPSLDHIFHIALRLAAIEVFLELLPIILMVSAVVGGLVAYERGGQLLPSIIKGGVLGPFGVIWVLWSTRMRKLASDPEPRPDSL
jgi:hypothetical protein